MIGPVLGCLRVSGPASFSVGVAFCPVPGPALTLSPAKIVFFGDLLEEAKRTKIAVFEQPFLLGRPPQLLRSSGPNTTKRPVVGPPHIQVKAPLTADVSPTP